MEANADTVYLKNGRKMEGFVRMEGKEEIELEIIIGRVRIPTDQIERIYKSTRNESDAILKRWEEKRELDRVRMEKFRKMEESKPKDVEIRREQGHIVVNALLNKKYTASLLLDTGASLVMLSNSMAKKIGVDITKAKSVVPMQLADGRIVRAVYINLDSIKVEDVEAKNVQAAVLLDDAGGFSFNDGLLGMSFLKRFNFKVDYDKGKLILEKLR